MDQLAHGREMFVIAEFHAAGVGLHPHGLKPGFERVLRQLAGQLERDVAREALGVLGVARVDPVGHRRLLGRLLQGDFGRSLRTGEPVLGLILQKLPVTIQLATASILVAMVIGLPLFFEVGLVLMVSLASPTSEARS